MKRRMKKGIKRVVLLAAAGSMGAIAPMTALASSPEFARSAQEWERLRDDVLEYDEIADLIHEYNTTVQNDRYAYNNFVKDYGRTKEDVSNAYRDTADDLEAGMSREDGMGLVSDLQLELQAKQLREQADDNLEDSKIYRLTYAQTEAGLVLSAQSKFLSYYKSQLELESARQQKKILENDYALTQTQLQAGTATASEVLNAREAVLEQDKTIAELEQQVESARQSLIVMCGWKGSDQPQIGALPETELSEIEAIDKTADEQSALENNYTLQINKRKLENAMDADNKAKLQKTIASNERQIQLSVTNAWQSLQTAKRTYEQAVSDKALEEQNANLSMQQWNAGMITQYALEAAQTAVASKEIAVQTAWLELMEALETYRGDVAGLASAE